MSNTKKGILAILTVLAAMVSVFQGLIPAMPVTDPEMIKIYSSGALLVGTICTVWIQFYSTDIANRAVKRTLIVAIVATLVGILDFTNVIHFSTTAGQWTRFAFQLAIATLMLVSKQLFPSEALKATQAQDAENKLQAK